MARTAAAVISATVAVVLLLVAAPARAAAAAAAAAQAGDVPTAEDIRATYERGDYHETLKQAARVLSLKGPAAEGVNRYELLMLRAESHLRLKATSGALQALEEAAKEAPDAAAAANARALAILLKRSKNLQYTPKVSAGGGAGSKGGGAAAGEPIDITDDERRGDALKALYEGERATALPKAKAAGKAKKLPAIAAALKAVVPLRDLELAATGKDEDTAAAVDDLVQRAHELMADGLEDMAKRTEKIADRANQLVEYTTQRGGRSEVRTRRRGLETAETRELKATIETCRKVIQSCKELSEGFAGDEEMFEDLEEQAKDTGERAHDVLTDNYSNAR